MVVDITTNNKILQQLGMTPNESYTYITLLKNPNKTAAEISRMMNLDKSSTYRACENLEKAGLLISSPQTKGTTYIAKSPDVLNTVYQNKLSELEDIGSHIESSIEDLQKLTSSNTRNTNIRIEYGVKALQKAMNESLLSKEKFIQERIIGDHQRYFRDNSHAKFVLNFAKIRTAKRIKIHQLEKDDSFKDDQYKEIMVNQKKYLKEVRLAPPEWDDTSSLRIWDDVINIITYDDNNEFVVITIKDKFVAKLMKNMYGLIWKMSKPIK